MEKTKTDWENEAIEKVAKQRKIKESDVKWRHVASYLAMELVKRNVVSDGVR